MTEPSVDPWDYYEEYSEWLMKNYPIGNGDRLVELLERAEGFDEFLASRKL